MKKTFALCAIAASLSAMAGAASASTQFLFNPLGTGAGGAVLGTVIDQAPGNALGVASVGTTGAISQCLLAAGWAPGATGVFNCGGGFATQFLYQANLAQITNNGTQTYNQGGSGVNFTFTASFSELVTRVTVNAVDGTTGLPNDATAHFILNGVQGASTNFFRMYASGGTQGNNLTGAGFGVGTIILAGSATSSTSDSTSTSACAYTNPTTCSNLDNANGDNWNGFTTVDNNGSTKVNFVVTSALAGYFPNLPLGSVITVAANTSQILPFDQIDPSCAMIDSTGTTQNHPLGSIDGNGNCVTNGALGTINGAPGNIGTFDFLFQADANTSLNFTPVPEPGTLALLAGGLMAAGFWGRRRSSAK